MTRVHAAAWPGCVGAAAGRRRPRRWRALATAAALTAGLLAGWSHPPQVRAATDAVWGIDSCDAAQTVVPQTEQSLGDPAFLARYLGTNRCGSPGLSASEVQYLASQRILIMLIADPPSYGTGTGDAQTAISEAESLGAPPGTAIFRDVEPNPITDPITATYIEQWYQAFAHSASGYVPGFYENPYPGSGIFPTAYCGAVAADPAVGAGTVLWSSEPEPAYGSSLPPTQANQPAWGPSTPACTSTTVA